MKPEQTYDYFLSRNLAIPRVTTTVKIVTPAIKKQSAILNKSLSDATINISIKSEKISNITATSPSVFTVNAFMFMIDTHVNLISMEITYIVPLESLPRLLYRQPYFLCDTNRFQFLFDLITNTPNFIYCFTAQFFRFLNCFTNRYS